MSIDPGKLEFHSPPAGATEEARPVCVNKVVSGTAGIR